MPDKFVNKYFFEYFYKENSEPKGKVKLMAYVYFFVFVTSLIVCGLHLLVSEYDVTNLVLFNVAFLFLYYIFYKYKNVVLAGNLLILLFAATLLDDLYITGGLYSDNLLWFILIPTIAILFLPPRWAAYWSMAVIMILFWTYYEEISSKVSYRKGLENLDPEYYLVSFTCLYLSLMAVIYAFVSGNNNTIAKLKEKSRKINILLDQAEQRNKLFQDQEKQLLKSNQKLEAFAYAVSHDLKEPLRMVISYSQVLKSRYKDNLSKDDEKYFNYVISGANRMHLMFEDLLNFSKLENRDETESVVDLNKILSLVEENLKYKIDQYQVTVFYPEMPVISGKPVFLVQVFQNLIANSIKFRRKDVDPVIDINWKISSDSKWLQIFIQDNGIGIEKDNINRIFGVFQRVHSKEQYEGSGIGLSTVKRTIEDMEGNIKVESSYGSGSTFIIQIPKNRIISTFKIESIGNLKNRYTI